MKSFAPPGVRARPIRRPSLCWLCALVGFASGCHRTIPAATTRPPVVLVVVDTLRADHVECYGYDRPTTPGICSLVPEALLFERAYAVRTETVPAISSILTGLSPPSHGVRENYWVLPEPLVTLAERLRPLGYATGGFVSSFVMIRDFSGFAQGFDVYDDQVRSPEGARENYERGASQTMDRALAWLDGAGPRPFLFVHLIEPHGPYDPPPPYLERLSLPAEGLRVSGERLAPSQRLPGVEYVSQLVGRYDGEIAAADAQIGRLIQHLREVGLFDRSLIVVTADHGESLAEGKDWFTHGDRVDDPQSRVPLLIKMPASPGLRPPGARISEPVSSIDIVPTILAAIGAAGSAPRPSGVDLATVAGGARRPGAPPITERVSRGNLRVMAHARDCAVQWTILRRPELDAAQWPKIVRSSFVTPASASDDCRSRVTREAFGEIRDALALEPRFPVVRRTDVLRPGHKTDFVGGHVDSPRVPLGEDEHEALRALGYAD